MLNPKPLLPEGGTITAMLVWHCPRSPESAGGRTSLPTADSNQSRQPPTTNRHFAQGLGLSRQVLVHGFVFHPLAGWMRRPSSPGREMAPTAPAHWVHDGPQARLHAEARVVRLALPPVHFTNFLHAALISVPFNRSTTSDFNKTKRKRKEGRNSSDGV